MVKLSVKQTGDRVYSVMLVPAITYENITLIFDMCHTDTGFKLQFMRLIDIVEFRHKSCPNYTLAEHKQAEENDIDSDDDVEDARVVQVCRYCYYVNATDILCYNVWKDPELKSPFIELPHAFSANKHEEYELIITLVRPIDEARLPMPKMIAGVMADVKINPDLSNFIWGKVSADLSVYAATSTDTSIKQCLMTRCWVTNSQAEFKLDYANVDNVIGFRVLYMDRTRRLIDGFSHITFSDAIKSLTVDRNMCLLARPTCEARPVTYDGLPSVSYAVRPITEPVYYRLSINNIHDELTINVQSLKNAGACRVYVCVEYV